MARDKKALHGLTFVLESPDITDETRVGGRVELVSGISPDDVRAAFADMSATDLASEASA
jgi:hypothetical protein